MRDERIWKDVEKGKNMIKIYLNLKIGLSSKYVITLILSYTE